MTFKEVEDTRIAYYTKHRKATIIAILIFIAMVVVFGIVFPFILLWLAMVYIVIAIIVVNTKTAKEYQLYKNSYKAYFVANSLAKIFTNINYSHELGLKPEIVRRAMTTADRYSSNDYMTATYKNINFTQADVHIEERHTTTDSNGHTRTYYVTIFQGRFLVFDFDRNFSTNLQVASRHFYGSRLRSSSNQLKFEKIKTESGDFNKKFKVYAEDGVDALYILDPAFMEKIQKLYQDCKHEILLTFINKHVYIAINDGKDSLEPPRNIRKPLDEKVELEKVKKDILVITNFVDSLNLDRYFKGGK